MVKRYKDYLMSVIDIMSGPTQELINKFPEFQKEINAKYIEIKKIALNKGLEEEDVK